MQSGYQSAGRIVNAQLNKTVMTTFIATSHFCMTFNTEFNVWSVLGERWMVSSHCCFLRENTYKCKRPMQGTDASCPKIYTMEKSRKVKNGNAVILKFPTRGK